MEAFLKLGELEGQYAKYNGVLKKKILRKTGNTLKFSFRIIKLHV